MASLAELTVDLAVRGLTSLTQDLASVEKESKETDSRIKTIQKALDGLQKSGVDSAAEIIRLQAALDALHTPGLEAPAVPATEVPAVPAPTVGKPTTPAPTNPSVPPIPAPAVGTPTVPTPAAPVVTPVPAPVVGTPRMPLPIPLAPEPEPPSVLPAGPRRMPPPFKLAPEPEPPSVVPAAPEVKPANQADILAERKRLQGLLDQELAKHKQIKAEEDRLKGTLDQQVDKKKQLGDQQQALNKQLASTKKGFGDALSAVDQVFDAVKGIAALSAGAFAGLVGGALAFAKAADPVGFSKFSVAIEILAMRIGRIFIPILRTLTEWIDNISEFFKDLSDEEMDQILGFTKIGIAITGVVAAIGAVVVGLGVLLVAFGAFLLKVNALLLSNPAGWFVTAVVGIAALVAALAAAVAAIAAVGAALFVSSQNGATWGEKMKNAIKTVWNFVKPFVDVLVNGFKEIAASVMAFASIWQEHMEALLAQLGTDWPSVVQSVQENFKLFFEILISGFNAVMRGATAAMVVIRHLVAAAAGIKKLFSIDPREIVQGISEIKAAMNPEEIANEMKEAVDKFDAKREQNKKNFEGKPGDHTPEVFAQKHELMGIGEAIRKAQTATTDDPRLRKLQEQLAQQVEAVKRLKAIEEAIKRGGLG